MRSILGLVRHRCSVNTSGPFVLRPFIARPQTSSLSSTTSSSAGSGGKRGPQKGSGREDIFEKNSKNSTTTTNNPNNKNKNNNNNYTSSGDNNNSSARGPKKSAPKSPLQSFKRMTEAVKEKAGFKSGRGGRGGDRISSDRVKHDRSSRRFILDLGNNQQARIDYRQIGPDNKIEMYHSEVPAELRGRGLGKALAQGALEQAARENMRVKLTCSYLVDFVNKSTDQSLKKPLIR